MTPDDLREPQRRAALYEDACHKGVIGGSPVERLTFYAAMARARRVGSINPCGMFRRIVETAAYRGYIADCDEDQGRAWLAEERPNIDAAPSTFPNHLPVEHPEDPITALYLTHRLQQAGLPTHDAFNLLMMTHEGRKHLTGWTQERWDQATSVPTSEISAPGVKDAYPWGLTYRS